MTDTTMLAQAVQLFNAAACEHHTRCGYGDPSCNACTAAGLEAALPLLLAAVVKECTRLDLEWVGPDYQQTREMAPNADGDYVEVGELQSAATRLLAQQQQQGKKEGEG